MEQGERESEREGVCVRERKRPWIFLGCDVINLFFEYEFELFTLNSKGLDFLTGSHTRFVFPYVSFV